MSPKVECGLVVGIYIMTIFGGWPTLHPWSGFPSTWILLWSFTITVATYFPS
jgi:hypothetical protein